MPLGGNPADWLQSLIQERDKLKEENTALKKRVKELEDWKQQVYLEWSQLGRFSDGL